MQFSINSCTFTYPLILYYYYIAHILRIRLMQKKDTIKHSLIDIVAYSNVELIIYDMFDLFTHCNIVS